MVMTVVSHRLLLASDCCSPLHVRLSLSHVSRSILVAGMTAQRRSELDWSYQTWPLALVMMLDLHAPHGTGDGSNSIGWENAPSSRRQRDSLAHVVPTSAWSCPILSLILMEAWLSARSCTASMSIRWSRPMTNESIGVVLCSGLLVSTASQGTQKVDTFEIKDPSTFQ